MPEPEPAVAIFRYEAVQRHRLAPVAENTDSPVFVETSGEYDELLVLNYLDGAVILNAAEASGMMGVLRRWLLSGKRVRP